VVRSRRTYGHVRSGTVLEYFAELYGLRRGAQAELKRSSSGAQAELKRTRDFREKWGFIRQRLDEKHYHGPKDFELYFIPLGITQSMSTMSMTLADTEDCGLELGEVLSSVLRSGNAQYMPLGELLAHNRHADILVLASIEDRLSWMARPTYTTDKRVVYEETTCYVVINTVMLIL
jgi:hypothetical protein